MSEVYIDFLCTHFPECGCKSHSSEHCKVTATQPALPDEVGEMVRRLRAVTANSQLCNEAASLIERLAPRWIPIESSPAEQDVLITVAGSKMIWCAYRVENEWYLPGDDTSFVCAPTHWQPLPLPPQKGST